MNHKPAFPESPGVCFPVSPALGAALCTLEALALRVGATFGPIGRGERFVFAFDPVASFVSVPAVAFERLAGEGLIDAQDHVTEKGREAARTLIGGPLP